MTGMLGGAEVTHIFAHDILSVLNAELLEATVSGAQSYCERSLLLARPWDVVCLLNPLEESYLEYLQNLGIGPERGNIIPVGTSVRPDCSTRLLNCLMANPDALSAIARLVTFSAKVVLSPYIASQSELECTAVLQGALERSVELLGGNPHIVQLAKCKDVTRTKALELGVPVPEGEIVELELRRDGKPADLRCLRDAIHRHLGRTGRAIVRGADGASGSSLFIVKSHSASIEAALNRIAERTDNHVYLIETLLELTVSPNIMMHIAPGNGDITCVGITDQILNSRLMHQGNIYPSLAATLGDMMTSARSLCRWLQAEGYHGFAGFDFGEYVEQETGSPAHFLAEINPRMNGSVYPKALMEYLNVLQRKADRPPVEAFLSVNMKTRARSFASLHESCGRLFFDPAKGSGFVPFNTGCLKLGKFAAALFGKSRHQVAGIYQELATSLGGAWT
ncbi:MAG: hypothetical protein AB1640_18345 [bacterium]